MFHLAETLGIPVYQLEEEMPLEEFFEWAEWFKYKAELEDQALKKAEQKARTKKGKR